MEQEGLPHPKTDVSFAPTNAFAEAFPDEVAAQSESFNQPTWQTRTVQPTAKPARIPATVRQNPDPIFDYLHDDIAPLIFGAIFFAGLAYLAFRGIQWHIN